MWYEINADRQRPAKAALGGDNHKADKRRLNDGAATPGDGLPIMRAELANALELHHISASRRALFLQQRNGERG
ncbi:hypothetical protein [Brenneria corticis]|uniref:Uncharacterized protein n=1 Tax=Brenneria corticis TaxID=2173106 RepID=A0A2U1TP85_9GAMM|nr:hypothetical protein [Brenneria sp. CFCC 11842]PWC11214.1 hypothetical protein DDT56_20155 [Brenneria sp. CFCC 11842]